MGSGTLAQNVHLLLIKCMRKELESFVANNNLVGDPCPGERKYLFIIWQDGNGVTYSGVVGENDKKGIDLP